MRTSPKNLFTALALVVLGLALAATGIYIGDTDDAPGAALLGLILMVIAIVFGIRIARQKA